MNTRKAAREKGQALVMVAMSLVAMMGMLGMVVDIGYANYVKKSAQAAADSAAKSAAVHTLGDIFAANAACAVNVVCQATAACASSPTNPPVTAIDTACLYAKQNGFEHNGHSSHQEVTIAADTTTPVPTAPGVNDVAYWVTATVTESIPQSFSRILGVSNAHIIARSTAVVTEATVPGAVFLINRQNDITPLGIGVNLKNGGNPVLSAPGGIILASTANGTGGYYAGDLSGTPSVTSPFTSIRGAGSVHLSGSSTWTAAPTNGYADGAQFTDPMGMRGQPAPPSSLTANVPVPSGCLSCLSQPLSPGHYYAVNAAGNATGGRLTVNGNVTFSNSGSGFGNYVFYGGVDFNSGVTTVQPGRFIFAGTQGGGDIISIHTGVTITDGGPVNAAASNAGEIFVFTDATYPGLSTPSAIAGVKSSLGQGKIDFQAGSNPVLGINLHGLNRTNGSLPSELKTFAPTVFWQDQRLSRVKYTSAGNIDTTSCGAGHTLDNPCTNAAYASSSLPEMKLQAHPNMNLYGLIYQPRGAWMTIQGNGNIDSTSILVTGALNLQGGGTMNGVNPRDSLHRRTVAIVE